MQNLPPNFAKEARPRFCSSQMQKPPGANFKTSSRRLSTADTGPAAKSQRLLPRNAASSLESNSKLWAYAGVASRALFGEGVCIACTAACMPW
jgi:hypothetical protein